MKPKKLKKSKRLTRVYKELKCSCSACKHPKKKLPHPVENCFCCTCLALRFCETSTANNNPTYNLEVNFEKLPIDGEDYGDVTTFTTKQQSWWDTFCRWLESPSPF